MSFEADGAGACCGMLRMGDIVLEVSSYGPRLLINVTCNSELYMDGVPAESPQQCVLLGTS